MKEYMDVDRRLSEPLRVGPRLREHRVRLVGVVDWKKALT